MAMDSDGHPRRPMIPGRRLRPGSLEDDVESGEAAPQQSATSEPGSVASKDEGSKSAQPGPTTATSPSHTDSVEDSSSNDDEGKDEDESASRCVLMGPSRAGKTTLLLAFDQACSCPPDGDDPFRLEFIGGVGTAKLAKLGILTIMNEKHFVLGNSPDEAFRESLYGATITATKEKTFWRPSTQYVAHLSFRDGPGGALFPGELQEKSEADFQSKLAKWEQKLLADAQDAETLVLCIDSTHPQPDLINRYMREILTALGQTYKRPLIEPKGYRLLKKVGLHKRMHPTNSRNGDLRLRPERRIKAKRFLLLLTKIDQLVSGEQEWPDVPGPDFVPPTPKYLAERLSPVRMACELLDDSNILRILNALQPEADFAVGLTSAWGFNPLTERPFMEANNPVGPSTQGREQRLLNWRPFGVREALLFITAGVASGPVERVSARSLGTRLAAPMFDVPSQFFGQRSEDAES